VERVPPMLKVIRESAYEMVSLLFSKLHYAYAVNDSGNRIFVLKRDRDTI